ncbi:MAG: hypothetical protein E7408_01195 [Ruminococcaceae bacterium]|nr:hypothetical protein [Oscillospiraceae bacterium]
MRKSIWSDVSAKKRHIETKTGGGIHTGFPPTEIPEGMATEMRNLHSRAYPHMTTRPPRDTAAVPALPGGEVRFFGVIFGTTLAAVVGRTLYTLADGGWMSEGTLFAAATGRVYAADFMDWVVFADGAECKKFDGTTISAVGTKGKPTNAKYLATHAWHLFSASDADKFLRYSAVENVDDWSAPGDAGQELVETTREAYAGGIVAYGGNLLYFKRNAMFELYGTDPVNFSLLCMSRDIGCISQASIVEIGGILYFMGTDGVYRYGGGVVPKKISFPIQKYVEGLDTERAEAIAAGSDGERYYLALPQKGGSTRIFAYDTRLGEWFEEDTAPLIAFASHEGRLYAADSDGTVYLFGSGGEAVQWHRISRPYTFENSLHQNWHRIFIRAAVAEGAHFTVALSPWAGGEGFRTVATVRSSGQTVIEIPPQLQDAPQMRVKLAGEGEVTVSALEFELRARARSYI